MDVDDVRILSDLRPQGMTGPHLDLDTDLGNRRDISANGQVSVGACREEAEGILAFGRCPGPVAYLL